MVYYFQLFLECIYLYFLYLQINKNKNYLLLLIISFLLPGSQRSWSRRTACFDVFFMFYLFFHVYFPSFYVLLMVFLCSIYSSMHILQVSMFYWWVFVVILPGSRRSWSRPTPCSPTSPPRRTWLSNPTTPCWPSSASHRTRTVLLCWTTRRSTGSLRVNFFFFFTKNSLFVKVIVFIIR